MSQKTLLTIIAAVAIIVVVLVVGSYYVTLQGSGTTPISVQAGGAQSAQVLVDVPIGNLTLAGGATILVDGSISYELPAFQPVVNYSISDEEGNLTIMQPIVPEAQELGAEAYPVDLRFSDDIPLDLTVRNELGEAHINLTTLSTGTVDVSTGSDADVVELDESHPTLTSFSAATHEGEDTVSVDCDCPSLLDLAVDTGSSADTIEFDGSYPTLSTLSLEAGGGDDQLTFAGTYPSLVSGVIYLGSGSDHLTLTGSYNASSNLIVNIGTGDDLVVLGSGWHQSLNLTVISEGDTTSMQFPNDVGVYIEIASRSNTVSAEGFRRDGDAYVNEAYGESDVTLNVNINTTPNEVITLTLGEG